eukprot:3772015-Prymnesium_polylepis.1
MDGGRAGRGQRPVLAGEGPTPNRRWSRPSLFVCLWVACPALCARHANGAVCDEQRSLLAEVAGPSVSLCVCSTSSAACQRRVTAHATRCKAGPLSRPSAPVRMATRSCMSFLLVVLLQRIHPGTGRLVCIEPKKHPGQALSVASITRTSSFELRTKIAFAPQSLPSVAARSYAERNVWW